MRHFVIQTAGHWVLYARYGSQPFHDEDPLFFFDNDEH